VDDAKTTSRSPKPTFPIRLVATDIDGTLLNPQFKISPNDLKALQQAHAAGIEIVLVTGRRHTFALPIAQQLGFDLWLISSNGAITRSLAGETFHRDLMPRETCRDLCSAMQDFRGHTVLTFDKETKGAIVLEHLEALNASIRRWLEKNMEYIEFVVPIENAPWSPTPCKPCSAAPWLAWPKPCVALEASGMSNRITVLRTEYPDRDLSMIDVLNTGCSKGHALRTLGRPPRLPSRSGHGHR
jgi:hydroxymethylpyrimidine pyrophosphatase-like HAD family hydrolase